jgi:hypothetical protein
MTGATLKPTPDEAFSHPGENFRRGYMHFGKNEQGLRRSFVEAKLRRTLDGRDEFSFAG